MFFRPKLSRGPEATSLQLLQEALSQYGVQVDLAETSRELQSLHMDDIDLVEAIQLVEAAVDAKVDKIKLRPTTTLNDLASLIDQSRKK